MCVSDSVHCLCDWSSSVLVRGILLDEERGVMILELFEFYASLA